MSDPLVELEDLTPAMAAGVEARKLKNSLGRAAEKLVEVPRQAARFRALVETAITLGATRDATARGSLRDAAEEADGIGDLLERATTPDDLQYATDDLRDFNQALSRLDMIVRQLWRELVQSEFQSLVAVGELLTRIERTRDLGEQLRQVGEQAVALAERKVPAEQLAPEIQSLRERRTALDAELHRLTDNQEVDAFLTAVTRYTATLKHITPAVVSWLERNSALEAFAVRGAT